MNVLRSSTSENSGVIPIKTYFANYRKLPVWEISFSPGVIKTFTFLVTGEYEQVAVDNLIDFCEDKYPDLLLKDDFIEELRKESISNGHDDDFYLDGVATYGGNHSKYLDTSYGIAVELLDVN